MDETNHNSVPIHIWLIIRSREVYADIFCLAYENNWYQFFTGALQWLKRRQVKVNNTIPAPAVIMRVYATGWKSFILYVQGNIYD